MDVQEVLPMRLDILIHGSKRGPLTFANVSHRSKKENKITNRNNSSDSMHLGKDERGGHACKRPLSHRFRSMPLRHVSSDVSHH